MAAEFQEAKRKQESFLAPLERRCLLWLAAHAPAWLNSDHLTLLGLVALAGAGLCYWWAQSSPAGLYAVIVCLALNWLGDSLDGTLARVRNRQRPRYGFYVDHIVDSLGALFLLGGLALSNFMSHGIAPRPAHRVSAALLRGLSGDVHAGEISHLVLEIQSYRAADSARGG